MPGPDYLNRNHDKPGAPKRKNGPDYFDLDTGVDWRDHENAVAKRSGGQRRAASGAAPGKPADTVDQVYLRECKATKGAGLTIKGEWLEKITQQALPRGMTPLLEIRVAGQAAPTPTDWVLIPAQEFETLLERLRGKRG
jgi:hypothetical protein